MNEIRDIVNYLEINPQLGTAGQPNREQFGAVRAAGYEVVINLVPETARNAVTDEEDLVTGLGMEYVHIPVIWTAPTLEKLDSFFEAMQRYRGRKIFVHCQMNMRVSAFVFLYRVRVEKVPEETAREAVLRIWEPDPTWSRFIEENVR